MLLWESLLGFSSPPANNWVLALVELVFLTLEPLLKPLILEPVLEPVLLEPVLLELEFLVFLFSTVLETEDPILEKVLELEDWVLSWTTLFTIWILSLLEESTLRLELEDISEFSANAKLQLKKVTTMNNKKILRNFVFKKPLIIQPHIILNLQITD